MVNKEQKNMETYINHLIHNPVPSLNRSVFEGQETIPKGSTFRVKAPVWKRQTPYIRVKI